CGGGLIAILACVLALLPPRASADTVLVTGANSGIGLEFAKEYAARGWTVIATHRRDDMPETLKALSQQYKTVRVEKMDVTSREQIASLVERLKGTPIDVLINNAGVFVLGGANGQWNNAGAHYDGQMFGTLDYDQFDTFMKTNVAGPARVTEAFLPLVKASKQKKIVSISSSNGQITGKPLCCGLIWYRTSKAALNKLMIQVAAVLKKEGVTVVLFNPGAVRVEKQKDLEFPGMIETPKAVAGMIDAIGKVTLADAGKFMQYDGSEQPW
ncbi:MAG TPA: SDR family oxidoreductase, partial [Steroidobacteraceae bacterium]|nr:SDR family oxidoreductase [Steroidobacteraceae bacterium]